MKKAFTLIELMIVVAIIAIIAAIAIPNLMESKKAANESGGSKNLLAYLNAQAQYQSNNYSFVGANSGDGTAATQKLFAAQHRHLGGTAAHVNSGNTPIRLLTAPVANAISTATAYNGYYFTDMPTTGGAANNYKYQHGLCSAPAIYGSTGVQSFIINSEGVVYAKDVADGTPTTDFPADLSTWVAQ